jgi:serine/threonine protein kinase
MIDHKRACHDKCDDQQLMEMLRGETIDRDSDRLLVHVENCERCQHRLDELVADESEWQKAADILSGKSRETDRIDLNGTSASFHISRVRVRPPVWTEAMAKSLLSPPSHPEMLGRIGRYDVERLIGSGGMGVVFKAYDTELNRPAAVKLLAPYLASSGSARKRFAREACAAAGVVDDHVVPIHNVESENDPPFLVMQYIAGGSLQEKLDHDGPLEVTEILRIGMQTAKGLAAAHAQGLIHRDVKPSNILLDEGVERALLTDFGLARAEDDACLTCSGFHPGTPHYMSPEQVRGDAIDPRSDLFGLGCVLYALCTGHPPFRAENSYAVTRRITDETPRPIREVNANIPEWLDAIVTKLLSKSRDDRFGSAEQVAELLEGCLAHAQQPTAAPLPEAVARLLPRRSGLPPVAKWLAAGAAALALVFAGVLIVLETNKGTLTIESEADDVPIRIKQRDETVRRLTVGREGATIRLHAGQYTIEIDGSKTTYAVTDGSVIVKRGEIEIAKVTYVQVDGHEPDAPTEARPLSSAVREFNHLYSKDGKGRPQQPLTTGEITARLIWMMGNGELSAEIVAAIQPMLFTSKRLTPAGWQLTGGLVRRRCEHGIIQTWEVNLETNGLSRPISIRRSAIGPPSVLRTPSETSDDKLATPLADAIDDFNACHQQIERFAKLPAELPPLTLDEVLAAIALWRTERDEADVDDATFERLQRIATTHQLPADASFELIPSLENTIGQWFTIGAIRVLIPRVDKPESTYAFMIRNQFIELDRKNPAATHWGVPGSNGIQAGFRLVPAQRIYKRDQVVDIEFLYRSVTGKEIPATLPRVFKYDKVRMGTEVVYAPAIDVQQNRPGGTVSAMIGKQPTVLRGQRMQLCTDKEAELKDGVTMKAIIKPGKSYWLQLVVPNPGDDALDEQLETGKSHYFNTPSLEPKKVLPLFAGHWYRHWGRSIPGQQTPAESTPDPEYIDPFQIGVSLGPVDKSRIPAYYAGGLQVTKVAPYSPAKAVGIEVGDILLSWETNQIYGYDPKENFLKYNTPNNQLKEALEKYAKYNGWSSFNMKFDLLDHRTGEVIRIAPWFGFTAGGSSTKGTLIKRLQERKRVRSE